MVTCASVPIVNKILNVKNGERCVLVGTLYKDMKLKPSILDEVNAREVSISFLS